MRENTLVKQSQRITRQSKSNLKQFDSVNCEITIERRHVSEAVWTTYSWGQIQLKAVWKSYSREKVEQEDDIKAVWLNQLQEQDWEKIV